MLVERANQWLASQVIDFTSSCRHDKSRCEKLLFCAHSTCYHPCMIVMRVIPPLMLTLVLSLPAAQAADDVLPPPQMSHLPSEAANQQSTVEKAPGLRQELQAPDDNTAPDIRSYERKDGTTITEYGARGRVFKIKVQPPGGMPAYYMYPDSNGHFANNLLGGVEEITPPSWILKKF